MSLRSDKVEGIGKVQVLEKELKNTLLQLHAVQLQLHSTSGTSLESDAIKTKLVRIFSITCFIFHLCYLIFHSCSVYIIIV